METKITPEWLRERDFTPQSSPGDYGGNGSVYWVRELDEDKWCDLSIMVIELDNGELLAQLFPYEDQFKYTYTEQVEALYFGIKGEKL